MKERLQRFINVLISNQALTLEGKDLTTYKSICL